MTKTILLGAALSAGMAAALATPNENEGARPGSPPGEAAPRDPAAFFRSLDADGDGAITREEAGERWERISVLDRDGDERITLDEFRAARDGAQRPPGPGRPEGAARPDGKGRPDGAGRPEGAGQPPGGGEEFFKRLDSNEDGKISKDEVPEETWARISRLDTNEDGHVSREEFLAGAAALRGAAGKGRRPGSPGAPGSPGEGRERAEEFFKRLDRNGDGKISKDEVPEETWTRLSRLDTDEDAHVSREEFLAGAAALRGAMGEGQRPGATGTEGGRRPGAPGRPGAGGASGGAEAVFSRYDENKDGKLSEDEVPAELWARIRRADEDADGLVSLEELRKSYQARAEMAPPSPEAGSPSDGPEATVKKDGASDAPAAPAKAEGDAPE